MKNGTARFILSVLALLVLIIQPSHQGQAAGLQTNVNVCRYSITNPYGNPPADYPIASLGVGGYLDWMATGNPLIPAGLDYARIVTVGDPYFPGAFASMSGWVKTYPGAIWLIGNEPDTTYNGQDGILAEVYADRFYELAKIIRKDDPSATIGFATIVQPTPLRIRYLNRAWNELVLKAGSSQAASGLIDVWSIHSFILNEKPNSWGTGVPKGFENDYADAFITDNLNDTISIPIFKQRIENFRAWMASKGERDKPLWITEYGSLIPPIAPRWTDFRAVTDQQTSDFLVSSFDYLLTAVNATSGMTSDQNHLVQRWFWYSLNDHRWNFGGSLFDPDNNKQITLVGLNFRDYTPPAGVPGDVKVLNGHTIVPVLYNSDGSRVDYLVKIPIGTANSSNAPDKAQVSLYENGNLVAGPVITNLIQRCGGTQIASLFWRNVIPGSEHTLEVRIQPVNRKDSDLTNNQASFTVPGFALGLPGPQTFIPSVSK